MAHRQRHPVGHADRSRGQRILHRLNLGYLRRHEADAALRRTADSFDGRADDQLAPVTRQRRRMEVLLGALDDDEWRSPTRCDGWTIQDVISHLVTVNAFWETSVRAGLAGEPTRVLATFDPAAHPPLMVDGMRARRTRCSISSYPPTTVSSEPWPRSTNPDGRRSPSRRPVMSRFGCSRSTRCGTRGCTNATSRSRSGRRPRSPTRCDRACDSARWVGLALTTMRPWVCGAQDPDTSFVVEIGKSVVVLRQRPPDAPCLGRGGVELVDALSIRSPLPAGTPAEWYACSTAATIVRCGARDQIAAGSSYIAP